MKTNVLYIGVAGLLAEHVHDLASHYEKLASRHKNLPLLFLGLQTSKNYLNGKVTDPFYTNRMNSLKQIEEACYVINDFEHSQAIVHYNPSGKYNPDSSTQLSSIMSLPIHGLQWNGMDLFSLPDVFFEFNMEERGLTSIVQVGKDGYSKPELLVEMLRGDFFQRQVTHLLFDGSGGRCIAIDEAKAVSWIETLKKNNCEFDLVISGGLGEGNIDSVLRRVARGVRSFPNCRKHLSTDTEGSLIGKNGFFEIEKAIRFLDRIILQYI